MTRRAYLEQLFGFRPRPLATTELFRAATVLCVWTPVAALVVTVTSWLLARGAGTQSPPAGLRLFAIALIATVVWLVRLPPPRWLRVLAVPALLATALAWVVF